MWIRTSRLSIKNSLSWRLSESIAISYRLYIVYRQVFEVPRILHFEPFLGAFILRSDIMSLMKILSFRVQGVGCGVYG